MKYNNFDDKSYYFYCNYSDYDYGIPPECGNLACTRQPVYGRG